ncbi:MAG TPA: class I SAM-dependent methyltransferase [Cyclobacteriaceae bacterium]|nr:class I SAM-dependent methyltransferase [Cyclobacteriaceae bacterium]
MKTSSGFDFLAPAYDWMARLVFGKAITESQTGFLNRIPVGANILILGGGTGWLLEKISEQNRSCKILYVDVSEEMIKRSSLRKTQDEIQFLQGSVEDIPIGSTFDVIITNFYLDLFSDRSLRLIVQQIHRHTRPSSIWLVTDFVENTWWHRVMLKVMYIFFRIVTGIDGSHLPAWNDSLLAQGWTKAAEQVRFKGFINTSFWVR